jgi:hypothetical protein
VPLASGVLPRRAELWAGDGWLVSAAVPVVQWKAVPSAWFTSAMCSGATPATDAPGGAGLGREPCHRRFVEPGSWSARPVAARWYSDPSAATPLARRHRRAPAVERRHSTGSRQVKATHAHFGNTGTATSWYGRQSLDDLAA